MDEDICLSLSRHLMLAARTFCLQPLDSLEASPPSPRASSIVGSANHLPFVCRGAKSRFLPADRTKTKRDNTQKNSVLLSAVTFQTHRNYHAGFPPFIEFSLSIHFFCFCSAFFFTHSTHSSSREKTKQFCN